jgi:type II secretory pathway component PulM
MNEWWMNLSIREKQSVALGTVLLSAFIIYELVFAAFIHSTETLRAKIHKQQSLLVWMQDSDKRIKQLEKMQTTAPTTNLSSLLSRVQNDLNQTSLQKNISQLQQAENDAIEIHFQQVNFDLMTGWLIKLCREQGLTITEMIVTPGMTTGIVDATLKLKA